MASRLTRLFRPENVRAALKPLSAPALVESTRSPVVKGGVSLDAISDKKTHPGQVHPARIRNIGRI